MDTTARPQDWKGSDLRSRAEIVRYLDQHGGTITDEGGLVVTHLRAALGRGRAISQLLADMEHDGMIRREVRGRRTFQIDLVDDWGLVPSGSLRTDLARTDGQRALPPAPIVTGDVDYDALANTLLDILLKRLLAVDPQRVDRLERLEQDLTFVRERAERFEAELATAKEQIEEYRCRLAAFEERTGLPGQAAFTDEERVVLQRLTERLA